MSKIQNILSAANTEIRGHIELAIKSGLTQFKEFGKRKKTEVSISHIDYKEKLISYFILVTTENGEKLRTLQYTHAFAFFDNLLKSGSPEFKAFSRFEFYTEDGDLFQPKKEWEVIIHTGLDAAEEVETFFTYSAAKAYVDDHYSESDIKELNINITHNGSTEY
ncbi:TPA: hypothetical protein I7730_00045 [Vibrio vulnificus]|uniref:Uncharacterized protein n=1 Tax=Vibrio vulnificus TaxID=672 RepID=A0A8H9K677_VIBVL|nr:hypothetical protein [Vibrio vulnificus]HAS8538188.1 hypothetical protein [Vibrio vulnificus]